MKKLLALLIIICYTFTWLLPAQANELGVKTSETAEQSIILTELEKEVKIGNLFDFYVTETFVILNDDKLNKKVEQIVEKLISVSGRLYPEYKLRIINDSLPIASSFPGGYIYISTGLLDILENEDELAAALANAIARMNEKYQYDLFVNEWEERKTAEIAGSLIGLGLAIAGGFIGTSAASSAAASAASPAAATGAFQRTMTITTGITTTAAAMATAPFAERVQRAPEKKVLFNTLGPKLTCKGCWHGCDLASRSAIFTLFKEMYEGFEADKELKALDHALSYLRLSDYNPGALASVLTKLLSQRDKYLSKGYMSNLLIVQPGLEKRIEHVNKAIQRQK